MVRAPTTQATGELGEMHVVFHGSSAEYDMGIDRDPHAYNRHNLPPVQIPVRHLGVVATGDDFGLLVRIPAVEQHEMRKAS